MSRLNPLAQAMLSAVSAGSSQRAKGWVTQRLRRCVMGVASSATEEWTEALRPISPSRLVDTDRLGDLVGHLTPEESWGIDEALKTVLDVH